MTFQITYILYSTKDNSKVHINEKDNNSRIHSQLPTDITNYLTEDTLQDYYDHRDEYFNHWNSEELKDLGKQYNLLLFLRTLTRQILLNPPFQPVTVKLVNHICDSIINYNDESADKIYLFAFDVLCLHYCKDHLSRTEMKRLDYKKLEKAETFIKKKSMVFSSTNVLWQVLYPSKHSFFNKSMVAMVRILGTVVTIVSSSILTVLYNKYQESKIADVTNVSSEN